MRVPLATMIYCSFCKKSESDVTVMIKGPSENICDECAIACNKLINDNKFKEDGRSSCSFCSKETRIVEKDATSKGACICEECTDICNEILFEHEWNKEGQS